MLIRWLATIFLLISAVGALFFTRSGTGLLISVGCLVLLLFIWGRPRKISTRSEDPRNKERTTANMTRQIIGIGLGLIAAFAAILLLPPQVYFIVAIIVGIVVVGWFIWQSRSGTDG